MLNALEEDSNYSSYNNNTSTTESIVIGGINGVN